MKNIPTSTFSSNEIESRYVSLFEEKLEYYKFLMDKVKEEFYGDRFKYTGLSGADIDQIRQITNSIIKMTNAEFNYSGTEFGLRNFSLGE